MMTNPKILIIAGPNGAGKTTFAKQFLPHEADCPIFVNADLIAAGLSPFMPEVATFKAGRLMLKTITEHVTYRENFAFETTLSGLSYARHIQEWKQQNFTVKLFFLSLPSADMAVERVNERVRQGGHHIPEAIIRRRFKLSYEHFLKIYKPLVNEWVVYDNSGLEPILIEEGVNK